MMAAPRRLRCSGKERASIQPCRAAAVGGIAISAPRRLIRWGRALGRGVLILLLTFASFAVQGVLLALPGRGKVVFARLYWAAVCALLGMQVRVVGDAAIRQGAGGRRPVLYVSNHSSWVDVAVLGSQIEACFVSKAEVAGWPIVGTLARLGRTVFTSRDRTLAAIERRDMAERLSGGDDLILFPEGTSSDGSRVLPFHAAFFSVAKPLAGRGELPVPLDRLPIIQPISLVYDRLAFMPVSRAGRPVFSWFGDMDIASHFWRLAQWRGMRATVLLHETLDPADFASRKTLSAASWAVIAEGAAALRQNRGGEPIAYQPQSCPTAPAMVKLRAYA